MDLSLSSFSSFLLFLSLLAIFSLPNNDEYLRANHPDVALSGLGVQSTIYFPNHNPLPNGPDTTVILLNWSRLPNVILITSVMCSPQLENLVSQVVIWNNNPSYEISLRVRVVLDHPLQGLSSKRLSEPRIVPAQRSASLIQMRTSTLLPDFRLVLRCQPRTVSFKLGVRVAGLS